MKTLFIRGFFFLLVTLCSSSIFAAESENQQLNLCIKGKGVNIHFISPRCEDVSTGNNQTVMVSTSDYTNIGGLMLAFELNMDSRVSAQKVTIKTTSTNFSSEHPIVNGKVIVQEFIPIYSTSYIYITVE